MNQGTLFDVAAEPGAVPEPPPVPTCRHCQRPLTDVICNAFPRLPLLPFEKAADRIIAELTTERSNRPKETG